MHFDAIHIDRVLVKSAAANIILAAQFIGLTHAGKGDKQALDRTACGVRHDTRGSCVDIIHRALGMLDTAHLHFVEPLFVGKQLHIDIQHIAQIKNPLLHRGITDHRIGEHNRVGLLEHQFVKTVFIGYSADRFVGIEHGHIDQFNTYIVLIHDVPIHASAARVNKNAARTQQQKVYYF